MLISPITFPFYLPRVILHGAFFTSCFPHYIILDLLLNTPVFTGFHKVHTEQMQAGTTSSASSGEKCVRQSQRPVVFGWQAFDKPHFLQQQTSHFYQGHSPTFLRPACLQSGVGLFLYTESTLWWRESMTNYRLCIFLWNHVKRKFDESSRDATGRRFL